MSTPETTTRICDCELGHNGLGMMIRECDCDARKVQAAEMERRAIAAIKTFPLPAQGATSQENYQRILRWLYDGPSSVASLVIDMGLGQ